MTITEHWRTLDKNGLQMPWYTRPCLEWLEDYVQSGMDVFEYGCGASTQWYESRGCLTFGVDHDSKWIPKGCGFLCTDDICKYLTFICDWPKGLFDLIIIDGIFRDECTAHALKHLKKDGYLIADNFEQASCDLADWPLTRKLTKNLPLTLYKEPTHADWQTAVWKNV